jgi:hypothetical protein
MNQTLNYTGSCFCGAVEFSLNGQPEAMGYCHCDSCRHWSAGQVNAFTLWKTENFTITKGSGNLAGFDKHAATTNETGPSNRKWCKTCGSHVVIDHPTMELVDVPAVIIEGFTFSPAFHVHYQETVHPMKDGLPKFKDLPAEAGGAGEELPE